MKLLEISITGFWPLLMCTAIVFGLGVLVGALIYRNNSKILNKKLADVTAAYNQLKGVK